MSNEWQTFVEERARELAMEKEEVPYGYHNLRDCAKKINTITSELDAQLKHYWRQTQGEEK
jgi:hypothetical protein